MALVWADGFDHYGTGSGAQTNMLQGAGAWAALPNTVYGGYPVTSIKRTGVAAMSIEWAGNVGVSGTYRRVITTASNEVGVGFGFYMDNLPSDDAYVGFAFLSGTTVIASFYVSSTGAILAYDGTHSDTLVGASDAGDVSAGAFNHIEMRVLRDSVVGEMECRVNGETVVFANNLDLGASNVDNYAFRKGTNGTGPDSYVDDMFCWDGTGDANNSFIGPARINLVFPVADTAQADWTPNTGSGYQAIDDTTPDGDTTTIDTDTEGDLSDFEVGTLPSEIDGIIGVYVPVMAKLADAGIGTIKIAMVSNAEVAEGPEIPLTASYAYWGSVFETNPDGDIPWTKTTFEAALLRVEKVL